MTANELPATQLDNTAAAQAAINYADNLRTEHDTGTTENGMAQAAVLAQLAQAKAQLAQAEATARVAEAIHELTASLRDNGITTW